jgi:translation initiation factor IF-3
LKKTTKQQPSTGPRVRINERIRVPQVRVIDQDGNQVGVMPTSEAIALAEERNLDLVEIVPNANPPVVKIIDFGKYKYEIKKQDKEVKKKQQASQLKEIRLHPRTDDHDLDFKLVHAKEFLEDKCKVRIKIVFRGREMAHTNQGYELAKKIQEALVEYAEVQEEPKMEGRQLTFLLTPSSKRKKKDSSQSVEVVEKP